LPDEDARIYNGLLTTGKILEFDDDGSPTAPGSPGDNDPSAQDIAFLRDAAQLSLAEVQIGELIVQKAQSTALRVYGQQLVNDHTAALQQLVALATQEQISVPTSVTSADRERLRRLGSANGPAFETLARQIAVQAHEEAITRFETALERVQDADIRGYARAQLPILRAHLQTARNLPVAGAPGANPPDPTAELPSTRSPFARSVGAWF
jgi:putative membrane protein